MGKERHGIHLIAEMANVSIGSVDRALHGRREIKDATRQRILQIARQIGYTPNLAARALSVTKATARIGICLPREIHFFYDQLWSGVLDEAKRVAQLGIEFVNRPVQALGVEDVATSGSSRRAKRAFERKTKSKLNSMYGWCRKTSGLQRLVFSHDTTGANGVGLLECLPP